jgi:hypothetical protein
MKPNEIVRLGICQVPEGRRIFPFLTVLENLDMGAFLRRDKVGLKRDLDYVLTLFPILAERRNQAGGTLSGGEQQMLAISRALMARPRLLLLDEPSLGLAPLVVRQIFDIIQKINQEQTDHDLFSGAKRQPGPEGRPPGLCHGKRPDHPGRCGRQPAGQRGGQKSLPGNLAPHRPGATPRKTALCFSFCRVFRSTESRPRPPPPGSGRGTPGPAAGAGPPWPV